jgi:hypothetical protein
VSELLPPPLLFLVPPPLPLNLLLTEPFRLKPIGRKWLLVSVLLSTNSGAWYNNPLKKMIEQDLHENRVLKTK